MLKSAVYTLVLSDDLRSYEFGVTSEEKPYFRHRYDSFHASLNTQFDQGGMIGAYKDEFGMWLSAFAPIKNSKNKPVGVVVVDEKLDLFLSSIRLQLWQAFLISIAIFLLMMAVLFYLMRNILVREVRDKNTIEEANNEIKRINKNLSEANEKLHNLDQFRKEMISNISHDLRTPLSSMIGFLEVVTDKTKIIENQDKEKYIHIAYHEAKRLNTLVTDLFELSKLENGLLILRQEPFNIYELVSDIIQKYHFRINAKHVNVHFEIHENLGLAYGDIKYIDRVFQNLLDNAVRYVYEGGYIKIWILDTETHFKVKICNNGDVISQEELKLVFDRYYVVQKDNKSGTGLGLAISKKICELHNCTIHAEGNEDVTSFWFTVPKAGGKKQ
jgi:signal transduction histidine kinase